MPKHLAHSPTVIETIAAVEAVLDAHADLRADLCARNTPISAARASFNGAALQLVELIAEAVVERLQKKQQMAAGAVLAVAKELTEEHNRIAG